MTVLVPSIFVAYAVSYPKMILKTARALMWIIMLVR